MHPDLGRSRLGELIEQHLTGCRVVARQDAKAEIPMK